MARALRMCRVPVDRDKPKGSFRRVLVPDHVLRALDLHAHHDEMDPSGEATLSGPGVGCAATPVPARAAFIIAACAEAIAADKSPVDRPAQPSTAAEALVQWWRWGNAVPADIVNAAWVGAIDNRADAAVRLRYPERCVTDEALALAVPSDYIDDNTARAWAAADAALAEQPLTQMRLPSPRAGSTWAPVPTAEAIVEMIPTAEGGRSTPAGTLLGVYRPHFRVMSASGGREHLGVVFVGGEAPTIAPGACMRVQVALPYPVDYSPLLVPGAKFEILEGNRVVGYGRGARLLGDGAAPAIRYGGGDGGCAETIAFQRETIQKYDAAKLQERARELGFEVCTKEFVEAAKKLSEEQRLGLAGFAAREEVGFLRDQLAKAERKHGDQRKQMRDEIESLATRNKTLASVCDGHARELERLRDLEAGLLSAPMALLRIHQGDRDRVRAGDGRQLMRWVRPFGGELVTVNQDITAEEFEALRATLLRDNPHAVVLRLRPGDEVAVHLVDVSGRLIPPGERRR